VKTTAQLQDNLTTAIKPFAVTNVERAKQELKVQKSEIYIHYCFNLSHDATCFFSFYLTWKITCEAPQAMHMTAWALNERP
jgi:hypothetical protein